MSAYRSEYKRITISLLLLLHLMALLLPAQVVSAADMQVVIPKAKVDAMVYQALWNSVYKDEEAVEALIYNLFILRASESGLTGDALPGAIGEFQEKVETQRIAAAQSAPLQQPNAAGLVYQYAEISRQMMQAAMTVKELQPVAGKVWRQVAGVFGYGDGVDQASQVARSARNSQFGSVAAGAIKAVMSQVIVQSQTNIFIGNACDRVYQKRTKVSVRQIDGAKTAKETPNLGIPQEVINNIMPNGTINISLNELKEISKNQFTQIDASITDMRQKIVQIDDQQKDLLAYMSNAEAREVARAIAEANAALYEETLKGLRASVSIVSTLVDFVQPGAGRQISTVLNSALDVADSMKNWLDAVAGLNGLEKLTSMSTVIMTGNVLGAVMNIVSMFGDSGPTPEQMILEEIGKLRQQVEELRTEMHDRFDRIDQELNAIYTTMQDRFNQIDIELGKINGNIKEVQKSLQALDLKLSRIERNNFEFLDALGRRPLLEAVNGGLGYQDRTGQPMPYQPDFVQYENLFQTWATIHAFDPLAAGPSQRDYSEEALLSELNAFPMDANLNYINGWLAANGYPSISDKRLPSPRDWLFATRAYVQLGMDWPQHMRQINPSRMAQMMAVSSDVEKAMRSLSTLTNITGTVGNKLLVTGVITHYEEKVSALENQIQQMEASHITEIRTNLGHAGADEGFNLYGGIDQSLQFKTPGFISMTNSFNDDMLPVPTKVVASIENYNRYNLADYLVISNTAKSNVLVNTAFRNGRNIPGCKPDPDVCPRIGTLEITIDVRYGNVLLCRLFLNAGQVILSVVNGDIESPDHYMVDHWLALKQRFETDGVTTPLTVEQAAKRAEQFVMLSKEMEKRFAQYQGALYAKIANEMTMPSGTLRKDALKTAGAKALVDSMVALGLPNALGNDDFMRSLLYGKQRIMDDGLILQTYTISATQPITGSALMTNPRLEINRLTDQRQAALSGLIDQYLDAITIQTHVESVDYIAEARKDLDLAMRIAQLAEQPDPAPSGNRIYLPLVNR